MHIMYAHGFLEYKVSKMVNVIYSVLQCAKRMIKITNNLFTNTPHVQTYIRPTPCIQTILGLGGGGLATSLMYF